MRFVTTPALANKLVIMLRTLIAFGIPRGYIDRNPAVDVGSLHVDVENTTMARRCV
jgi:hypothetical protein